MTQKSTIARLVRNWLTAFVDPHRLLGVTNLHRYFSSWKRYLRLSGKGAIRWKESYPCLTEWTSHTPFDSHYFYQAAWATRKLVEYAPALHVDVGSSVIIISIISGIIPTVFIDYRPLRVKISGLVTVSGDLCALPFANDSIHSLSCLHVIEHIGLGRYGDSLDPQGSIKAAIELMRVLAPKGRLLLSTPLGRDRVQFNAHRIFSPETLLSMFSELELRDFSMVDDAGMFSTYTSPSLAIQCEYACGMFEFIKKPS